MNFDVARRTQTYAGLYIADGFTLNSAYVELSIQFNGIVFESREIN